MGNFVLEIIFCSAIGCLSPQWPLDDSAKLPLHCAMATQTIAAEWLARHPTYRFTRSRCMPAGRKQENI